MGFRIFLIYIFFSLSGIVINDPIYKTKSHTNKPQPEWKKITSEEDVWQNYPNKIRALLNNLDLNFSGLKDVKMALQAGDTILACQELVDYYKNAQTADWLRSKKYQFEDESEKEHARQLLSNKVTFGETTDNIPVTKKGGWKWTYTGPEDDDEFGYSLNGHKYFPLFLKGWHETENQDYVKKFDLVIRDWIIHNPLPDESDSIYLVHQTTTEELDWRDIGEVVWRDLEVGRRFGVAWPQTFFGFQQSGHFTPASRLLMLYSIPVQAEYLKKYHKRDHNWTTIEMDGLGLAGLAFPEFKKADKWVNYAMEVMEKEINGQVYPDGTQTELSTKTQWVALSRFESLVNNFRNAERSVPESYLDRVEEMYNYMAYVMRPDGHQPLNNDSDREDLRPRVLKAAREFDRPDWIYIATNGKEGEKPEGLPSHVFPWAGIHVMRSGWDKMSHWSFFDTGPFGTGHQHSDMLHLSVHAYGRDILVDGGRFTHKDYFSFDPALWRGYFRSSFSHNVILIDGRGQNYGPLTTGKPLKRGETYINTSTFDYARGPFSDGFVNVDGKIEHSRSVFYLREKLWVVVDNITTDRPRKLEVLWHYHPDCNTIIENNNEITSDDKDKGNLRIVPVGEISWEVNIIKGKTEPVRQGWYSETYGRKEPNPAAVYSASVNDNLTFAWVLLPAIGQVPKVQGELLDEQSGKVKILMDGEEPLLITAPPVKGNPGFEIGK